MTTITLSTNPTIAAWETADNASIPSNLPGVWLRGTEAAAYLFGTAIASFGGSASAAAVLRSDAVFEFPAGSGNLASLNEIADALRYKYDVDPLIEFSSQFGVPSYTVADLNALLESLNNEFASSFSLTPIDLSPASLGDYEIDTRPLMAGLEDLIDADGRAALLALGQTLRAALATDGALRDAIARAEISVGDAVFDGRSLDELLTEAGDTLGVTLSELMPDAFYGGRYSLATVNTLLAAAAEANPDEGVALAPLASNASQPVYQAAREDWLADIRRGLRGAYAEISGFDASSQTPGVQGALIDLANALARYASTDAGISRLSVMGALDADAAELEVSGQRISLNTLLATLQLEGYAASVLPNLSTQGLTLRDVNKLLATARGIDLASAEQWPAVAETIRAVGDDGRAYTGARALVQRMATVLDRWLTQTRGTPDNASLVPLPRSAQVFADPFGAEGSTTLVSIDQLAGLTRATLGEDPFAGVQDWYRSDLLTLRDALYALLPVARLPLEPAPAPLDEAALAGFINRLVPASPPITGETFWLAELLFVDDQSQTVGLNNLFTSDSATAPVVSLLADLGILNDSRLSVAGLKQLIAWGQSHLAGITADADQFLPDAPSGTALTPAEVIAQAPVAESRQSFVLRVVDAMQYFASTPTADWDLLASSLQDLLDEAPEGLDVAALQAIAAQDAPALTDFSTWLDSVAQHSLAVVEQYDRTVEALNATLASQDLQSGTRGALEQLLATVIDRHDRFVEARGLMLRLSQATVDRGTLWAELTALLSDPVTTALFTQLPDAGGDVLQMLRRFDTPAEALDTYRTVVVDTAPQVFDLTAARAVTLPTPESWQAGMQTTLGIMTDLRARMSALAGKWAWDINFCRNSRPNWSGNAAWDNAAADRMQVWYDDVTTYGDMLDQLLAVQSDPEQFEALLRQFETSRGTSDLLGDMGYYSLPQYINGIDWWAATGIPFLSTSPDGYYAYIDIEKWNDSLDYSGLLFPSGARVGALADITDDTVTQALASHMQALRALAATDAGAASLVDGTSAYGAVRFGSVAADIDAHMGDTLAALDSSIATLQALQIAGQYLTDAGQTFKLFDADDLLAMADRQTTLTSQRDALTAGRTALAGLTALGDTPTASEFADALALARAALFPGGSGTEDVMALISSFALVESQLDPSTTTIQLRARSFEPAAWRTAADFSGDSYNDVDLDPHTRFASAQSWTDALQDIQAQLAALPDFSEVLGRLSLTADDFDLALQKRSTQEATQRIDTLYAGMLRTDLSATDIPTDLRAPLAAFANALGQLTAQSFAPDGVIDIDADLFDPVNGTNTRSLRDLLTALRVDHHLDALPFMAAMGIVVGNRWASREGLNRLIEVLVAELPDQVTTTPFAGTARISPQQDDGSPLADVAAVVQYVQRSLRGLDDTSVFGTIAGVPDAIRVTDAVLVDPDAPSQRISLETLRLRVSMRWGMDPFTAMDAPGRTVITAQELNGWKALLHFTAQAMAIDPNATADTAPWYDTVTTGGTPLVDAIDPALIGLARDALSQISSGDFAIGAVDINAPLMRDASGDRLSLRDLMERLGVMDTLRARGVVMDHYVTADGFNRMTEALGDLFADLDVAPILDPLEDLSFDYMYSPTTVSGGRAALYTAVRVIGSLQGSLSAFSTINGVPYALSTDEAVFDDPSSPGSKVSLDVLRERLLASTGFDLFATFSSDASALGHGNRVVTAQELNGLTALAAMAFDPVGGTTALKRVQNWSAQDISDVALREVANNESYDRFSGVYDGTGGGRTVNEQLAMLFRTPAVPYDPSSSADVFSVQNFAGRITIADAQSLLRSDTLLVESPDGGGGGSYLDDPTYAFNRTIYSWGNTVATYATLLSCDSSGNYSSAFVDGLSGAMLSAASSAESFVNLVWQMTYGTAGTSQLRQRVEDAGGFPSLFGGTVPSPFTLNHLYGALEGVNAYLLSNGWTNTVWLPSLQNLQNYTGTYNPQTWGYNSATIASIRTSVQSHLVSMYSSVEEWSPPPPPPQLSNWAQAMVDASNRYATALDAGPGQAISVDDLLAQTAPLYARVADLNALSVRFADFAGLDAAQRTAQWADWRDATDALLDTMATDWGVARSTLLERVLPTSWSGALFNLAEGATPALTDLRSARAEIDQARDSVNREVLALQARVSDDAATLATALEALQVRAATSPYENLLSDLMRALQGLGDDDFDVDGQLLPTTTLTGPRGQTLSLSEFLAELEADAPDDVRAALQDAGGLQALAGEDIDLAALTRTARDQWISALVQAIPALADQVTITPVSDGTVDAIAARVTQQASAVRDDIDQMALWWEQLQAWAGQGLNTRTGLATNPAVDESGLGFLYDLTTAEYDSTDPDTWYADRAGASLWGRVRLAVDALVREPDATGANATAWRSEFYASIRALVTELGGARDRADFGRTLSIDAYRDRIASLARLRPTVDALVDTAAVWANGSDAARLSASEWAGFKVDLQNTLDGLVLSPEQAGLDPSLIDAVLDSSAPQVTATMTRNWLDTLSTRLDLVLENLYQSSSRLASAQRPAGVDAGVFGQAKGEEIAALQTVIDRFQKAATALDQLNANTSSLEACRTTATVVGEPEVTDLLAYLWRMDVGPESLTLYRTDGALRNESGAEIASYAGGYFDFAAWQATIVGTRSSPYADAQLTQGPTPFERLYSNLLSRQQSLEDGLLQAQANLDFRAADIGNALSALTRVEVPTGYDGLWYQIAFALENLSPDDLGNTGVSLDLPVIASPPGSGSLISFNALLEQLEAGMPEGSALADCFSAVDGFSAGAASDPLLTRQSRADLLSAIYAALPTVAEALSGYPAAAAAIAGAPATLSAAPTSPVDTISARITEQRTLLLETPRIVRQPPATDVELREMITDGAGVYIDRYGAWFINGIRTTARDLAVTSRLLVHEKLGLEYKELMDSMAERNNLISAARETLNTLNAATGDDDADRLTLYSSLLARQELLGSNDLLSDMTAGQFTLDQLFRTPALRSSNGALAVGHRPTLEDLSNYLQSVRVDIEANKTFYEGRIAAATKRFNWYASHNYDDAAAAAAAKVAPGYSVWLTYVEDADKALRAADQLSDLLAGSRDPVEFGAGLAQLEAADDRVADDLIAYLADFAMPQAYQRYGQLPTDPAEWAAGQLSGDDDTIRVWDGSQGAYRNIDVDWDHPTLGLTPNTVDATLVYNALGTYENTLWTTDIVKWKYGELTGPTESFGLETYYYDVTGRTGLLDVRGDPVRGHKGVNGIYSDAMWKQDTTIGAFGSAERASLSALLNTLISNKIRDGDLEQSKLQSLTAQLQNNVELMSALVKAFRELTSALAQALR